MATPAIQLKQFSEFPPEELGERLHHLIYHGGQTPDPHIAQDFPGMVRHYATPESATRRVQQLIRIAAESRHARGFLAVVHDGVVVGVVTFAQEKLEQKKGWGPFKTTTPLVEGPLLACWLARPEDRPGPRQYLLPHILRAAARLLVSNGSLRGNPWTLVRDNRDDRGHVGAYLRDVNNGFGGFQVEHRGEFSEVDGVTGERKVFVCQHEIETLRS
jgi:hypothetical protein